MMDLRATLQLAHTLLTQANIDHALIGGLALACYGSTRATQDLDLLIHENQVARAKELLEKNGFTMLHESPEVLQFDGIGLVDILIARRPISQRMLFDATPGGPEGIRFLKAEDLIGLKIQAYVNDPKRELQDKADIQFLIESGASLDWVKIRHYADLFNQWESIDALKKIAGL